MLCKKTEIIGLKRGTVILCSHSDKWSVYAEDTINELKNILGSIAIDIQHVGSTSIKGIMAKPIIDIAVGVKSVDDMKYYTERLKDIGVIFRGEVIAGQMLFVKGDFEKDTRSHHIHVVEYNSKAWRDYVNFRDYLNTFSEKAKKYESIKIKLANMYPLDRKNYTEGKESLIHELLMEANLWKQDIDLMT